MGHIPSKVEYGLQQIYQDLFQFAAQHLKMGGRLVCWIPVVRWENQPQSWQLDIALHNYYSTDTSLLNNETPYKNIFYLLCSCFSFQVLTRSNHSLWVLCIPIWKGSLIIIYWNRTVKYTIFVCTLHEAHKMNIWGCLVCISMFCLQNYEMDFAKLWYFGGHH